MRNLIALSLLIIGSIASNAAVAQPDRNSFLEAWQLHIASLPGTATLEPISADTFRYVDTDLPYDGELKIVGVLIRNVDTAGYESEFTHVGMVEFELADLPLERLSSQLYYYWLTDRQSLHYSDVAKRWVDPASYQKILTEGLTGAGSFGPMSFMMNYGIWVFLIALIIFVFTAVAKQMRKTRSLMDESAAINQQARENIERASGMQDEVLAIARESRDLQSHNNALLKEMLDALKR